MLRRIAIAAITAVAMFYSAVFLKVGTIWFFEIRAMQELVFMFFFMLATFWTHEKVAQLFNSNRLISLPAILKGLLEGVAIILISIIYCVLFIFLLQYYLIPTVKFYSEGVRLALLMTSVISLFFYYFVERERSRKKLREELLRTAQLQKENFRAQLESLKNQVNPHFLFNSLNVLGSLIYKDQDQAVQFLGQLSEVYRVLLDSSEKPLVPLKTEMELANAYIYLMQTRFGDNLQFKVDVPEEKLHYLIPPTSIQMLLENAIKHNGSTSTKPLIIELYAAGNMLVLENNLQPRMEQVASTGIGLQNIKNRYSHLTSKQVEAAPTGHKFVVRLPLLQGEEL